MNRRERKELEEAEKYLQHIKQPSESWSEMSRIMPQPRQSFTDMMNTMQPSVQTPMPRFSDMLSTMRPNVAPVRQTPPVEAPAENVPEPGLPGASAIPVKKEGKETVTQVSGEGADTTKKQSSRTGTKLGLVGGELLAGLGEALRSEPGKSREFFSGQWAKLNNQMNGGIGGVGGAGGSGKVGSYPEYVRLFKGMPGVGEVLDLRPRINLVKKIATSGVESGIDDQALVYMATRIISGPGIITASEIEGTTSATQGKIQGAQKQVDNFFKEKTLTPESRRKLSQFIIDGYNMNLSLYDDSVKRVGKMASFEGLDNSLIVPMAETVERVELPATNTANTASKQSDVKLKNKKTGVEKLYSLDNAQKLLGTGEYEEVE